MTHMIAMGQNLFTKWISFEISGSRVYQGLPLVEAAVTKQGGRGCGDNTGTPRPQRVVSVWIARVERSEISGATSDGSIVSGSLDVPKKMPKPC